MLYIICEENNDLYTVALNNNVEINRVSDLDYALNIARSGDGILVLADNYPKLVFSLEQAQLDIVIQNKLRLYVEYPKDIPGYKNVYPQKNEYERVVVNSNFWSPVLDSDTILNMHSCWFLPFNIKQSYLYLARVAGYNHIQYDLPEEKYSLLFEYEKGVLIASSKLSQFLTGRYAPHSKWIRLWEHLLTWLSFGNSSIELTYKPIVMPRAERKELLPQGVEMDVFFSSRRWFYENTIYSIVPKKGVIEGFESTIDFHGLQKPRPWPRSDCIAETAMVFAYDWLLNHNPESKELASQLLNYVWMSDDFYNDDAKVPEYGLLNWYERGPVFYGDDNARAILASYVASAILNEERWLERITRCLLANLRTTGELGFRRDRIDLIELKREGWQYFRKEKVVSPAPHYQAYLWAVNLWAYALSGDDILLKRTKNAIAKTMELYPKWRWTNGFTQELARMILPLAYLIRIEDKPLYYSWLRTVTNALLVHMQSSGGIHEFLGPLENGKYPSPQKNEDYGTGEASLIQNNGDPACDLLYTNNFAFLGLHEAASVTKDKSLLEAEEKMADFLCRIQARSRLLTDLDGAWMRSFDDELWEYWGSSADRVWGAWCVETGWTNSWIASVFGMRLLGQTLFSDSLAPAIKKILPKLKVEMFGKES